jgi:hypothetical protein
MIDQARRFDRVTGAIFFFRWMERKSPGSWPGLAAVEIGS